MVGALIMIGIAAIIAHFTPDTEIDSKANLDRLMREFDARTIDGGRYNTGPVHDNPAKGLSE